MKKSKFVVSCLLALGVVFSTACSKDELEQEIAPVNQELNQQTSIDATFVPRGIGEAMNYPGREVSIMFNSTGTQYATYTYPTNSSKRAAAFAPLA